MRGPNIIELYYLCQNFLDFRTDSLLSIIGWSMEPKPNRVHTPSNDEWEWIKMEVEKILM